MTKDVKRRLIAFLILSAVGIVYVAASYLGFVDKVLGRGFVLHADLPESGGLYVGSPVTYRGIQVGEVSRVVPTDEGIAIDLAMEDKARIPLGSPFHVHNLTAVGEQYLDFEPTDGKGPFAEDGDRFHGTFDSLPVDEGDLLVQLDEFVNSVDQKSLQGTVKELGDMFRGTGQPLADLIDGGTTFVDEASAHEEATAKLLSSGLTVLKTQQGQGENIRSMARDLRLLTGSLKDSDRDLRKVLQASPSALKEVNGLLTDLTPTMPILLGNLITDNSVVLSHLPGLEQLLVTFPRVVSSGFSGTPDNGWGRISLQTDNSVGPCREGYLKPDQWRRGDITTDAPPADVRCASGAPYNMRGGNYAPPAQPLPPLRAWRGSYDPVSGRVYGANTRTASANRLADQGDLTYFGGDSWKWMVISPVMQQ
jgi:phospholipid/cholesterol/gamma-HCH transport system substrate-binding protein